MARTIDDELFMGIMHFSRSVRRHMMGEGPMPHPDNIMACGKSGHAGHAGHPDFGSPDGENGFGGHPGHPEFPAGPGPHPHGRRRPVFSRERILTVLADHEEGLRQKQLSEYMHVNASSISEFINHLEDDGYIVRTVDPTDKRATLISLTEKGYARAYELQDDRSQKLQQLFGGLTEEEKKELLRLIQKLGAKAPDQSDQ